MKENAIYFCAFVLALVPAILGIALHVTGHATKDTGALIGACGFVASFALVCFAPRPRNAIKGAR